MGLEIQIAVNWEVKGNKFEEYYDLTGQFFFFLKDYCILSVKKSRLKRNKRKLRTLINIRVGCETGELKNEIMLKGVSVTSFESLGLSVYLRK